MTSNPSRSQSAGDDDDDVVIVVVEEAASRSVAGGDEGQGVFRCHVKESSAGQIQTRVLLRLLMER